MRLIFIRHGEPDYATDTLTENGRIEAAALAERTVKWDVDRFFCSPLGRARLTAEPTLRALGRTASERQWLQEFMLKITDPVTNEVQGPWDLQPEYMAEDPVLYDREKWFRAEVYKDHPEIEERWREVCGGLDEILEGYGYKRSGRCWHFQNPDGSILPAEKEDIMLHGTKEYEIRDDDDEKTAVFFCHFGVTCVMLAHLLGVSPMALWHGTVIPPTGITVVNAEKRYHNTVNFRIQTLGDCTHLLERGVRISGFAAFSTVFQK